MGIYYDERTKVDYVLRNKEGKELARFHIGEISEETLNAIDGAKWIFRREIASGIASFDTEIYTDIEFNPILQKQLKREPEQLSLFSVGETKGIK